MDGEQRMYTIIWSGFWIVLGTLVFLVSSCCVHQDDNESKLKMACIQKGGTWVTVPGSTNLDTQYVCTK